jgi:hypothetical protein
VSTSRVPQVAGALALLAGIGFIATTLGTMATHGLDQPMFDQYRQYLALLEQPFPQSLLMLDNGHRPVLPALVRWLDLHRFGGGQHLANGLAMLLLSVNGLLVATLAMRARRIDFATRAALAGLALLALSWLVQARMLVQGSEAINVQIIVSCLIVGAHAVGDAQRGRTAAGIATAVLAGLVATFTFGPGIAVFPALLLVGYACGIGLRGLLPLAIGFVATLVFYLFALPGDESVRDVLVLAPLENLHIAAQWLAAPWVAGWLGLGEPTLVPDWASENAARLPQGWLLATSAGALRSVLPAAGGWWSSSALVGICGLALAGWVTLRSLRRGLPQDPVAALLFAVMLFGAACAVVIGITRLAFFADNPGQVFADRYLPWSCLFWLGLVGSLVLGHAPRVAGAQAGMRYAVAACVIALLLLPTHMVHARWASSVYWHAERLAASIVAGVPDPAVMPHPDEADVPTTQRTVAALQAGGLAMFAGRPDRLLGTILGATEPASASPPMLTTTRYASAFDGSPAVYLHGETTRDDDATPATPLWVVDADGRVVGYGTLAGSRPGWTTWSPRHWRRLTIDAYARMPAPCSSLTVLAGTAAAARVLARVDPCTDTAP